MPDIFMAEAIRREALRAREAASANDALPYYERIMADDPEALVRSFAARQPVLDDPCVGRVEGTRELRAFASGTAEWLRDHDAVVENVALTCIFDPANTSPSRPRSPQRGPRTPRPRSAPGNAYTASPDVEPAGASGGVSHRRVVGIPRGYPPPKTDTL